MSSPYCAVSVNHTSDMNPKASEILVLALGNDIMGDDAAALEAAEILKKAFSGGVDFVATLETGLALMDLMSGYRRVLLLDSVTTGHHKPGTIIEFAREDFNKVLGPSPHCMGLPEVLELADCLSIDFPQEIIILAIEIEFPSDFSESLGETIRQKIPIYVDKAATVLNRWLTNSGE